MPTSRDRVPLARAGVSLAAVAGALALSWVFHPATDTASFLFSLGAVAAVSALAGVRAGLAVTVLCIFVIDYFFLAPRLTLRVILLADVIALALFSAVAVLVTWLVATLDRRRRMAEQRAAEAAAIASLLDRQVGSLQEEIADRERLNPRDGDGEGGTEGPGPVRIPGLGPFRKA